ncbi:TIGR04255 family protein [Aeromonas veronii]
MGIKLNNAPVYYTLAQVQFNPILGLDAFIPSIQTEMRKAGFPDFRNEIQQQVMVPFGGMVNGQMVNPSMSQQSRYMFGDIDATTHFIVDNNSLILQSTNYDTFDIFSVLFLKGLSILHNALHIDFVERIGLRYLDAVQPKAGETLKDYLVPEVLGLSMRGEGTLQQSFSETGSLTTAGQLISRVIIREGQIGLPIELNALAPAIASRFTDTIGLHAIVDTDCFVVQREPFHLDKIKSRLINLHAEISKSFNATVTDFALKAWN